MYVTNYDLYLCKSPPNRTLLTTQSSGLKGSEVQITYQLYCNADRRDKLKPLFIVLSKNSKAFGRIPVLFYGFCYTSDGKVWMTGAIFATCLTNINSQFRRYGGHILLILNTFSGHTFAFKELKLTKVKVHFLPPNMTSHLQPYATGIIQ